MRIAYVTTYDASDVNNWSGLGFFIERALKQQGLEVVRIGPLKQYMDRYLHAKLLYHEYVTKKHYQLDRDPGVLRFYAKQVSEQLKGLKVDLIFSPGTIPISYLESSAPIVFWTDATYAGMKDFYPGHWSNLCKQTVRNGNRMEQAALSRSRLAIYSSDWAAKTARTNYVVDTRKIKVVPFGPNFETTRNDKEIDAMVRQRGSDICKLLFVGVNWHRKGGDIAVELAKRLNSRGIRVQLTVVGCRPDGSVPDFVIEEGFVTKALGGGQSALTQHFAESHFLVLPTRADCLPVVIPEANSCGLPVLTSDVGGIATAITNGINGAAFPLHNFVEQASTFVLDVIGDRSRYEQLALSSFKESESKLNWCVAGRKVREYLEEICLSS